MADPNYENEDDHSSYNEESDDESDIPENEIDEIDLDFCSSTILSFSRFTFSTVSGPNIQSSHDMEPIDIFNLFISDDIIELIVEQTNNYALELQRKKRLVRSATISRWKDRFRQR